MKTNEGKWSKRFLFTAIIQGAIAILLTILLGAFIITSPYPKYLITSILENPSIGYIEISALAGLGLYFLVGVLGIGVSSYLYHYFEIHLNKNYKGVSNALAWLHLLLVNNGITSSCLTMIYAGFIGDMAIFPKEHDGFGMSVVQVSQNILNQFIVPVGGMLLITTAGAICGGLGFAIAFIKK
jgi:hypothetical protein